MGIPTLHVEAGIRSYNRSMPEEVNRIVADTFGTLLFCPIARAVENLHQEGIRHQGVFNTGDVMCDLLELLRPRIKLLSSEPYYFATIHRPYNADDPSRMLRILYTLNGLDLPVVFALHPRTASRLQKAGIETSNFQNIRFMGPVSYLDSLSWQAGASCIITDSGGIQKEAYMLRKQCITLRSETEWPETLSHGWNTLVFEDIESVSSLVHRAPSIYLPNMFGDGHAAEAIVQIIKAYFERSRYGTATLIRS
jgi:UDP-GlcNAc3NAcA epimerase